MIIVSDTSPLTNLAAIERLDILHNCFDVVIVPDAVAQELLPKSNLSSLGMLDVSVFDWIIVKHTSNSALVASLSLDLDLGEAEAIALAHELSADVVLIDERRGRRAAEELGLRPLGLLGVLVLAKRKGIIHEIKPILDDLITRAGFWIGNDLYSRVLGEVSEH